MSAIQTESPVVPLDRVIASIKKACEDSYRCTFAAFSQHLLQFPSTDFVTYSPDSYRMEYIRDRFLQDGFDATMSIRNFEGKDQHAVTVTMKKHLPPLPCTCGCKSLFGHVEVAKPPTAEKVSEPVSEPTPESAEVKFAAKVSSGYNFFDRLIKLGYQVKISTRSLPFGQCELTTRHEIRISRNQPITLPRTGEFFRLKEILLKDQSKVASFLQSEGFLIERSEVSLLCFRFPPSE